MRQHLEKKERGEGRWGTLIKRLNIRNRTIQQIILQICVVYFSVFRVYFFREKNQQYKFLRERWWGVVKADLEVFQKFIRFCKSRHPKVFPNSLQPELVKPETIKFVPTSSCPAKEDGGREE